MIRWPFVLRSRLEAAEAAHNRLLLSEQSIRLKLREQADAATYYARQRDEARAELAAIHAKRSASVSAGNRTRAAKRRGQ